VLTGGSKRGVLETVSHDGALDTVGEPEPQAPSEPLGAAPRDAGTSESRAIETAIDEGDDGSAGSAVEQIRDVEAEEGPVHRPLIRATLPRPEGQPSQSRPGPDFTIRQPAGRPSRFRPRHQRGGGQMFGNRNGNLAGGSPRGGAPRHGGGRPAQGGGASRPGRRQGRKRSK
jgi:hypothetical protein